MKSRTLIAMFVFFSLTLAGGICLAATVTIPHSFTAGTPAMASQVNANFEAIANAINGTVLPSGSTANRLVVSKAGTGADGSFTTISDALASVTPTAENPVLIDILPGTYTENIVLKSFVHLRGSGAEITSIQAADPTLPVAFLNVVESVAITGLAFSGGSIGVHNVTSSPMMDKVSITENAIGMLNQQESAPTLVLSEIALNTGDGMQNNFSSPAVFQSAISKNGGNGVNNTDFSSPALIDTDISLNTKNGVTNTNYSAPALDGCSVTLNGMNGIINHSSSPGITNTAVEANKESGIFNDGESSPGIVNCSIAKNSDSGVRNENLSSPDIIMSSIALNEKDGIVNSGESSPLIKDSTIAGNLYYGIKNTGNSDPTITESAIDGNLLDGIYIDGSSPTLNNNLIGGNGGHGIYGTNASAPLNTFNTVTGNTTADIYMAPSCSGVFNFNTYDTMTGTGYTQAINTNTDSSGTGHPAYP